MQQAEARIGRERVGGDVILDEVRLGAVKRNHDDLGYRAIACQGFGDQPEIVIRVCCGGSQWRS
jgi:hypothetical protein